MEVSLDHWNVGFGVLWGFMSGTSCLAVLIRLCCSTNRKSAYPFLPQKHRAEGFVQEIDVKWIHHLAVEWVPGTALELLYLTQPLALQLEIGSGSRGPRELLRQLECRTDWAVDPACSGWTTPAGNGQSIAFLKLLLVAVAQGLLVWDHLWAGFVVQIMARFCAL